MKEMGSRITSDALQNTLIVTNWSGGLSVALTLTGLKFFVFAFAVRHETVEIPHGNNAQLNNTSSSDCGQLRFHEEPYSLAWIENFPDVLG